MRARKKRKYYREEEKLSDVLKLIHDEFRWTLGDFLHCVFAFGSNIHRDPMHAGLVQAFLKGTAGVTPAKVHNEVSGLPRASRGDCEEVNVVQRLAYAFELIVMQVVSQTVGDKLTAQVAASSK